jgi:hypothetical protein
VRDQVTEGVAQLVHDLVQVGWSDADILGAVDELAAIEHDADFLAGVEHRLAITFDSLAYVMAKCHRSGDVALDMRRRLLLNEAWDTACIAQGRLDGPLDRLLDALGALGDVARRIQEVT